MAVDTSASVHPTAIVEDGAVVSAECRVGPYCVVGPEVSLAPGVELHSHVAIAGQTEIGAQTRIWPFASIGHQPQDLKFSGERTRLVIGARNMIREHVTMNPGTKGGGGVTTVGDDSLFMIGVHIGHDCTLGDGLVLANHTSLGGHVVVQDNAVLGGQVGVHQFCRIGRGAMVGVNTGVMADVIPYGMVTGNRGRLAGLNILGLKRRGVAKAEITELRRAYAQIFEGPGSLEEKAGKAAGDFAENPLVQEVAAFILSKSSRSLTVPG